MKKTNYIEMLKSKRRIILIKLIKQIKELKIKQKEIQVIPIIENFQIDKISSKLEENKKCIEKELPKKEHLSIANIFSDNYKIKNSNLKNPEIEDNDIDDLDSYFPKHKIYYDQDSSSIDDFPEAEAERSRTLYTYRYR